MDKHTGRRSISLSPHGKTVLLAFTLTLLIVVLYALRAY